MRAQMLLSVLSMLTYFSSAGSMATGKNGNSCAIRKFRHDSV